MGYIFCANQNQIDKLSKEHNIDTPTLSHLAYIAIFNKHSGIVLKNKKVCPRTTVGSDLGKIETEHFVFLEQNPHKTSDPAKKARNGAKIMWIIDKDSGVYLGFIENGVLTKLRDPRTKLKL
jgi:hypothetical protein